MARSQDVSAVYGGCSSGERQRLDGAGVRGLRRVLSGMLEDCKLAVLSLMLL